MRRVGVLAMLAVMVVPLTGAQAQLRIPRMHCFRDAFGHRHCRMVRPPPPDRRLPPMRPPRHPQKY